MKKIYLLIPLVILVLGLITFLISRSLSNKRGPSISPITSENTFGTLAPVPTNLKNGEYNFLALGNGGTGHEGGILTDSMMVIHLNTVKKTVALIFIPRDLWVNNIKINEAYSKGGFSTAKEAVGSVTGLAINYGVIIDFPSFVNLIDSLGGIDVKIAKTFDDYFYPIQGRELETCGMSPEKLRDINATMSGFQLESQYTCRYEHLHFDAGTAHMDGTTALKFARSRHSGQDGSDFARGGRQQEILIAIKDKLLSLNALKNIDKWYNSFSKLIKTDLDLSSTKAIANLIVNPQDYKISQIVPTDANILKSGTNSKGQFILMPKSGNWQDFADYILKGE